MSEEFQKRVNFETVFGYCMKECVTSKELEPCYEMVVSLMGDCSDEVWLQDKEDLKMRKQELSCEHIVGEVLTKYFDDGKIEKIEVLAEKLVKKVAAKKNPKMGAKKSVVPKLTSATFTYRYLSECPNRLMLLYQGLVKSELIEKSTKPDDFMMLFEGKPSDVKIKWVGNQASLWYLFKVMLEKGYVEKPDGVGQWIVVQSHFVDGKSKMFADFNKQKPPLKMKGQLEILAELLNPNSYEEMV